MGIILSNALLVDIDPPNVEVADLRVEGGRIVARGKVAPASGDEVIDCGGAVVLPGFVNGHTHLYSALAVGMPAPPRVPRSFHEILQLVWWRLDRALDPESIEMSARIGAIDALRSGTTTLIDHHASPNSIASSLDRIEKGLSDAGVRGVLCYEVTDRNGPAGREAGIEESRRYIAKAQSARNGMFAALSGAHASFTMDDSTLRRVHQTSEQFGVGVHIHVAEDSCDDQLTRERYQVPLIERLARERLLGPQHVFGHCIHLSDDSIGLLNKAQVTVAHNPRSNMNNAVGYAPLAKLKCPVMLGTDGIGADMLAEARHAWFKSRDGGAGISPADVIGMLATSARRASSSLGVRLGTLTAGAAADLVLTDHVPATPIAADTVAGHLIFGLSSVNVRDVMVNGVWRMRNREISGLDEPTVRRQSVGVAREMWTRMSAFAP